MTSPPLFSERALRLRAPVLKLGAVMALSLGLAACGGGDGDPVRVAQARFSGMETLQVSRVSVLDQDGQELYAQSLNCETPLTCHMELSHYSPPEQLSFKFYNADDQLVSVSDVYRTDRNSFALSRSDTLLGTYLFRTYAARHGVSPLQLSVQLATFFQQVDNLDGTPDHFNELGRLYQTVRQDPTRGYGELAFYAELKKQLDSQAVLRPSYMRGDDQEPTREPPSRVLLAAASTDSTASCPKSLEVISEVATDYGKFIPYVGESVGKFIGKAFGAAVGGACDQSDNIVEQLSEVNNKLDEIQEQLHELDAKVVALGYRIEQLQKAVYDSIQNTALGRFYDDYNQIVSYTSIYHNMLNPMSKTPYKNLNDYVQKNGGLKQSTFGSETALYALLRSMAAQNQAFKGLALKSNLESLANAFSLKCEKAADMSGDVAQQRGMCNLLLATITAQFSEAQSQLALLMKDEVAMVYQQYQAAGTSDREWIEKTFVSPFIAGWDSAQTEVNATLEANLAQFGSALGNSFVPVLQDLTASVHFGLSFSASCRSEDVDGPAISAWYPNDAKPYVVVHCYNAGRTVKSRFQYNAADSTELYKNILGVPVVARTSDKFTDRSTGWAQTGPDSLIYAPSADVGQNGLAVKLDPQRFAVNNQPIWPKWIMEPYAAHVYTEWCDSPVCQVTEGGGQRYIMKKHLSADGMDYFTSRLDQTNSSYSDGNNDYIAATLSYTVPEGTGVDSGITLVWQVELRDDLDHNYNGYSHPFQSQWRLRCLTDDCSASGDHLLFENNGQVGRITLEGPKDGWKSFVISRY